MGAVCVGRGCGLTSWSSSDSASSSDESGCASARLRASAASSRVSAGRTPLLKPPRFFLGTSPSTPSIAWTSMSFIRWLMATTCEQMPRSLKPLHARQSYLWQSPVTHCSLLIGHWSLVAPARVAVGAGVQRPVLVLMHDAVQREAVGDEFVEAEPPVPLTCASTYACTLLGRPCVGG